MGEIIDSIIDNTCTELSVETSTIRANAFRENTNLTTFTDPNVINLGDYAFARSGITRAYFPNAQVLGKGAFRDCNSLTEVNVGYPSLLPDEFCSGAGSLQFFPMESVKTFGKSCLSLFLVGRTTFSNVILTDIALDVSANDTIYFDNRALAGVQASAYGEPSNVGRVIADGAYYVGFVETEPINQTVMIYDGFYYNDAKTPETAKSHIAKVDDMVIVEPTGEPYIFTTVGWKPYIPTYSASYGEYVVDNNRMRSLGFKVKNSVMTSFAQYSSNNPGSYNLYFLIVSKDYESSTFSCSYARALKYLRFEKPDGTLTNVYPFTYTSGTATGRGTFTGTQIHDIDFTNVQTLGMFSLGQNDTVTTYDLPNVTYIEGGNYRGTTLGDCANLETIYLGNGTTQLTIDGLGIWAFDPKLYLLSLNYTNLVQFTNTGSWKSNLNSQLKETPIYNYKGTTSTTITAGSNTNPVMIYGTDVTCVNGDIVTYDGKQYKRVSNKWQEWGTDGDKRPRVVVPNSLVNSYVTDVCGLSPDDPNYFEKWGNLNLEVYYADVTSYHGWIYGAPDTVPEQSPISFSYTQYAQLFEKPSNWDSAYNTYYVKEDEYTYTLNEDPDWTANTYYERSEPYYNFRHILSITSVDLEQASNVYIEIFNKGVLQDTVQITGSGKVLDWNYGANDSIKATLHWTGTLYIDWNTIACFDYR